MWPKPPSEEWFGKTDSQMQEDKLEENVTVLQVKGDRKLDQGSRLVIKGRVVGGELAMEGFE